MPKRRTFDNPLVSAHDEKLQTGQQLSETGQTEPFLMLQKPHGAPKNITFGAPA
jgi:hypothetical protein